LASEDRSEALASKGGGGCFLKGCLVCLILMVLVGGYCAYRAKSWARSSAAFLMVHASETGIKSLELDAKEEEEILAPVRELAEQLKAGDVSLVQSGAIAKSVMEGPVVHALICKVAEAKYLKTSTLPQEELGAAMTTANRFMQAMIAKKVPDDTVNQIREIIAVRVGETHSVHVGTSGTSSSSNEQWQLKDKLTDDEIRQAVTIMQQAADGAGIGPDKVEIKIGEELRKAIHAGLVSAQSEEDSAE